MIALLHDLRLLLRNNVVVLVLWLLMVVEKLLLVTGAEVGLLLRVLGMMLGDVWRHALKVVVEVLL